MGTALALASAWLMPLTVFGAALTFIAVLGLVNCSNFNPAENFCAKRPALSLYFCGVLTYLIAFHWLSATMQKFSGLPAIAAGGFFALFCLISALQFPLFHFFNSKIHAPLKKLGCSLLAPAISWIAAQELFIRIFPWTPGHALIAVPELAQLAYVASANGCTVFLFLLASLLLEKTSRVKNAALAALLFGAAYFFGAQRLANWGITTNSAEISVALVQGNISVEEKHSRALLRANVQRYFTASMQADSATALDLIVWPESVLLDPISSTTPAMPGLALPNATLLLGALSYDSPESFYNSAFGVAPRSGKTSEPYHKQILMPFGEYTPGLKLFPFLKNLNENAAEFSAGTHQVLIPVTLKTDENQAAQRSPIQIAPLICYEDVVSSLANIAALNGAQVLVNMSNDGWFGTSVAARQHHQIASWRAVETGLPLLRTTNTGFTAVVNHFGITEAQLPEHQPGVLFAKVKLGTGPLKFGARSADIFWHWLSYAVLLGALLLAARKRRKV